MTAFNHQLHAVATAVRRQLSLNLHGYIKVDIFAGGGGASIAIENATGEPVDVALNHDAEAISLHERNHPYADHYQEDVRKQCPIEATGGRPVGHLHGSPECTDHSQAKGGQPRSVQSRSLSWEMLRWTGKTKPLLVTMENVIQILKWGNLIAKRCPATGRVVTLDMVECPRTGKTVHRIAEPGERVPVQNQYLIPSPKKQGRYWHRLVAEFKRQGYQVLYGKINAADYGAPTTRERLFFIARRDGMPLHWPEPTHAKVPKPGQLPWVPVASCIDWSIPCPSIFLDKEGGKRFKVKRPLVEKTMARIRKGIERFVLNHPDPFIVSVNHGGTEFRGQPTNTPARTITGSQGFALVQPELAPFITEHANASRQRNSPADAPVPTLCAGVKGGHFALTVAYLAQHNGGYCTTPGHHPTRPATAITTTGSQQNVVTASLVTLRNGCVGRDPRDTAPVITAGAEDLALMECTLAPEVEAGALRVAAFLMGYYGSDNTYDPRDPAATITTRDRLALVTVMVKGNPYVIVDIGMRMLTPAELYRAQGFPTSYVIDKGHDGRKIKARDQVRMVGNSVSPPALEALLRANPLFVEQDTREAA
ncbi:MULTISPECIES: DNA cytosine methyltransferase [unclassified Pseudomonas]|uniref:DNA cytosine methyltransferase n=1 Tax=unclassified Pseudomonas TaxID=196821 RepID=UPI00244D245C|nr:MULTISPECIES: DNA cytosine methyltransferase [unclassified Pseudomonas]MDG9925470.1 DNA cytosine methyltransferase [Pseudomonas sp. GD04045]MDH0034089.1 DNA cytosine methyltransferase [Pseudomonas sp. GD04019]